MLLSVWAIVWLLFRFLIDNNDSNLWKFTNLSRIVRSFWMSASHVAQQENWRDIRVVFAKQTLEHQWTSTYFRLVNHPGFFKRIDLGDLGARAHDFVFACFCYFVVVSFFLEVFRYIFAKKQQKPGGNNQKKYTYVFWCLFWHCRDVV